MKADLHNHTTRCNHASGSVDDYIKTAISKGIDAFGFSCHGPIDGFDPQYRMSFEEKDAYEKEVLEAKERYKDECKILLAYEVDFLEGYMSEELLKSDVDYFIGSVHFLNEWGFDNPEFIYEYSKRNIDSVWEDYFLAIQKLAESGKFDIVGHMDLIKIYNFMPKKDIRPNIQNALKAIKKSDMVIEINASGFRKPAGEQYPSREILEMAYELDIPITLSSDSHATEHIGYKREEVEKLCKDIGYNSFALFEKRDRELIKF